MATKEIEQELYEIIHQTMPIACVDLVVLKDNEVLLLERLREPDRGKFWFPGGRIRRNENLEQAAIRILKEETGLIVGKMEFVGPLNCIFVADPFGHGKGTHTISFVFAVKPVSYEGITLDEDHSCYVWLKPGPIQQKIVVPDAVRRLMWDTVYNAQIRKNLE
jgi:colanic acid biosynthesis protein WcaH